MTPTRGWQDLADGQHMARPAKWRERQERHLDPLPLPRRGRPARAAPGLRSGGEAKARAAEERTALVRFLVVALNIATYWAWLEPAGLGWPALAAAVSVAAFAYGCYDLLARPYRRFPAMGTAAWTTVTDGGLITLWLVATGGAASPYYLLWYLSLVAVTFRYDWRAPLVAAGAYSTLYVGLVALEGQLAAYGVALAIRVGYILLCGGLGAMLARESGRAFDARFEMDLKVREAERFRALAEASSEALVVSAGGVVLECNQAYCRMMGLPRSGLVGRRLSDLVLPGSREALADHIADPTGPLEVWRDGPDGRQLLRVEARRIDYLGRAARFASIRDVTAERAAARRADRIEAQLRLAVEAGEVGTWDLDLASGEVTCSPRFEQLLGAADRGAPWDVWRLLQHVAEEDQGFVQEKLDAAALEGVLDVEFRVTWPDGSVHWVSVQGQTRRDGQGLAAGLVGVARDTTGSRMAEKARLVHATEAGARARAAKDRLAAVVDSSIDGILTKDLDGVITGWNPACRTMFGYTAKEAIGKPSTILLPPGTEEEDERMLREIRQGRPVLLREAQRVRKDGSTLWVSVSASPLRDASGAIVGCAAIKRDITAVRALANERAEATARLAAVVDSSIDGILTKDLEGRITSWNPACKTMFGYSAEEILGRPITVLYPKGQEAEEEAILERIRAGQPVRIREAQRVRKDGSTLWVSVSASPLRDASGRIVGAASIKRDVSEARAVEQERREARERAQELARLQDLNRFKTRFINTAAHELRTPLLPLRMQLDLMMTDAADPPSPAQREAMEVMRRNLERLGGLVEDLLTVARSEAGRLELRLERVALARLLRSADESFQPVAKRQGIRLEVRAPGSLEVAADPARVGQVLANLLGNAFKFTPAGGAVELSARPEGDFVRVRVADTGRGIARANQARLFQPFVQVHDTALTQPGSGLGLYICKQIVELHGGAIGVESPGVGKGSAFWFTLPRAQGGPGAAPPRPRGPAKDGAAWPGPTGRP